MARVLRRHQQGECHHVINRGNLRARLFFNDEDYRTFVCLLAETVTRFDLPLLGYCVMPNHWHLVVLTKTQSGLSRAMHWLTTTHTIRWCRGHERPGPGHVYQGRFRSVPLQAGLSLCRVLRYVERNALEKRLCECAEAWPWGSAYQRLQASEGPALLPQPFLAEAQWLQYINSPEIDSDIGDAIRRNLPIGDPDWVKAVRGQRKPPDGRRPGRPPK